MAQEVATWASALLGLVGFGLSLGLNPALYGATADLLARGETPWSRLSWMAGGLFVGATILYVLFQTFNPTSFVSAVQHRVNDAVFNRTVDLIAGIVFVLLGVAIAMWALRVKQLPSREPKPPKQHTHMLGYFAIGVSSAVIGFTTLPIMYLVGRITTGLSADFVPRLLAYAVFLVALAAPFFALAWVWRRFPNATGRITDLYTRALHWDYRWLLAAVSIVAGLVFLALATFWHH